MDSNSELSLKSGESPDERHYSRESWLLQNTLALAITTFRESVRSKVLYAVIFFALIIVLASALFGSVTLGDQVLVIKNLGLASISLFSVAYAIISGASLLHKELSKKTVYNILSKPVPRSHFLLGKYFGMLGVTWLMTILMGIALSVFVGLFEMRVDHCLWLALYFTLLELVIICAAAIFFSSIVVTPLLSGLFTFGIFLAGRSSDYLLYFIRENEVEGPIALLLKLLYYLLPHLDDINHTNSLVNGTMIPLSQAGYASLYALGYAGILLLLSQFIFKRKEFN